MSHALVVDDKESGRRSLRAELEDGGFDVTVAASAHDALKALEDLDPSLIVTDFIEFLRRVRAFSDVPIVVITAYDSPELRRRSLETGATHVLNFLRDLASLGPLAQELVRTASSNSRRPSREATRTREQVLKQAKVERVYLDCDGNVSETSRRLSKSRGSVRYQLRKLGIEV
jgi:two-component system response regulator VicR/two-component system response regulator RegX3